MSTSPSPAPKPTRRRLRRVLVVLGLSGALFLAGGIGLSLGGLPSGAIPGASSTGPPTRPGDAGDPGAALTTGNVASGTLNSAIAGYQQRLTDNPEDYKTWANLGAAYVQQARITLDPTYYSKAEGALDKSLALNKQDNINAMLGMGTLANGRHDFAGAVRWGQRARAISSYNPAVYGVLTDAYLQLGQRSKATAAVERMLQLGPGVPSFSRAAFLVEESGQVGKAREFLLRALRAAHTPADTAFTRYYLGELAYNNGDLDAAAEHYRAGKAADPAYTRLDQGLAKVAASRGQTTKALDIYRELTQKVPSPAYLTEYGELLAASGRTEQAAEQFDLVGTVQQLFTANGVIDDLVTAEFEAEHGSPAEAVTAGRAEWDRRTYTVVADALGWALHKAGKDDEALEYLQKATARGWRNALFYHHRAEIYESLGDSAAAARDRATVQDINPNFDPELPALGRVA